MKKFPLLNKKIFNKILKPFFLISFLLIFVVSSVSAQSTNKIELSKPDLSEYPTVRTYFRAFDANGDFIKNLETSNLRIQENDQVVAAENIDMLEPGVRFIVAINEGPTLANRYNEVTRIERVKTELTRWANNQSVTSMSDFSLISNSGTLASMLTSPTAWVEAVDAYQPDMKKATPGLASLSSAVDLATSTASTSQKTAAILYFTPLPSESQMAGLQDILTRAKQANIRLFIWLTGPALYSTYEETALLQQTAEDTNGAFFLFTGSEELPSLSAYLDPLQYIYRIKYTSQIKNSGEYNLTLRVTKDNLTIDSDPVIFTLEVKPPNPIFLSPPSTITRTWTETERKRDSTLTPNSVDFQIMVEFPDSKERDLAYSRLFIDNKLVDENTSAPFDTLSWDISGITVSGEHTISATVEDSAGFIAGTVDLSVDVVVEPQKQSWFEKFFTSLTPQTIIIICAVIATGVLLGWLAIKNLPKKHRNKLKKTHLLEDPVTQPVIIENEVVTPSPKSDGKEHWPHIPGVGLAPARLLLQSTDIIGATLPADIALSGDEVVIGSDSKKAKVVINALLINPMHAKIDKEDKEHFKIFDLGSGSGTWLNYAPVSTYGARLEHGDLVQFGRVAYRFEIYGAQPKKIQVLPYEDKK